MRQNGIATLGPLSRVRTSDTLETGRSYECISFERLARARAFLQSCAL